MHAGADLVERGAEGGACRPAPAEQIGKALQAVASCGSYLAGRVEGSDWNSPGPRSATSGLKMALMEIVKAR